MLPQLQMTALPTPALPLLKTFILFILINTLCKTSACVGVYFIFSLFFFARAEFVFLEAYWGKKKNKSNLY